MVKSRVEVVASDDVTGNYKIKARNTTLTGTYDSQKMATAIEIQSAVKYSDLELLRFMQRINLDYVGVIRLIDEISHITLIDTIDAINFIDTIAQINNLTNVGVVDLILQIDRLSLLDRITLIDSITNIGTIGRIGSISSMLSTSNYVKNATFNTDTLAEWEYLNAAIDHTLVDFGNIYANCARIFQPRAFQA